MQVDVIVHWDGWPQAFAHVFRMRASSLICFDPPEHFLCVDAEVRSQFQCLLHNLWCYHSEFLYWTIVVTQETLKITYFYCNLKWQPMLKKSEVITTVDSFALSSQFNIMKGNLNLLPVFFNIMYSGLWHAKAEKCICYCQENSITKMGKCCRSKCIAFHFSLRNT